MSIAESAPGDRLVTATPSATSRRPYDNRRRRERAEETRDRIVAAGADLARESIRDWRGVTIVAVAERAGVNRRTVYRHFANERVLRDAVMERLMRAAGVDLAALRLDGVAEAASRILRSVPLDRLGARPQLDPTLADASRRQHDALLGAVEREDAAWSSADQTLAAAMLDVLWSVAAYERLARDWQLDVDEAMRGITWVIGLVEAAVRDDRRPPEPEPVQ
jgi:AcrR family transcriptional regulator